MPISDCSLKQHPSPKKQWPKKMQIKPRFYNLDAKSGRQDREGFKANPFINVVNDSPKETVKPS